MSDPVPGGRRAKKHGEHANHERWLVSYADFITLLFAFFVVMYALSVQDLAKVKAAAESIRKAFGGPAVLTGPGHEGGMRDATRLSPFAGSEGGEGNEGGAGTSATSAPDTKDPHGELHQLKSELEEIAGLETGESDLNERMQTVIEKRGLVVRLSAKDFFAPGESLVRSDLHPLLDRIGRVVARSSRPISIEGYSDVGEATKTPGYASDWELSAARAAWVARYWIGRFSIDPSRIGIAGFAHFRPLPLDDVSGASGGESAASAPGAARAKTSAWERGKNRRIEIVILNP